ncbi:predicted protein, partial [Nematostella vectensis]
YDSGPNHEPCLVNGRKAHWAVISGSIWGTWDHIYLLVKQSKSRHTAVWSLNALEKSNCNLFEFGRKKGESINNFVLPEGGLREGLNGKLVFLTNKK